MQRPYPWEAHYPPGVDWGAPIATATLPAFLDMAVAAHGGRWALRFAGRRIGYDSLGRKVARVAAGLLVAGLRPGQAVALLTANSPCHPIAFFAVLRAGGRVTHLTPLDPARATARKMRDVGADWLIVLDRPALRATADALLAEGACARLFVADDTHWDDDGPTGLPEADPPKAWPDVRAEDLALLQFTGGTTGLPKAAMLTHANLTAAVATGRIWAQAHGRALGPTDRVIGVLPLFHIYALTSVLLRTLEAGAELLLRERFDVAGVLADIEVERATFFAGVPTMWTALAAAPDIAARDLSSLRVVFSGGAPLPPEVAARLERLTGHRMAGGWGMTETAPAGTNVLPGRVAEPGEIGVPLPGIALRIVALDDPGRELPPGETGEIAIRGPNVTQGYWNRPEETRAAFADGWFLTGDLGHMTQDGRFFLVDRKKDMILSGGFNVYPRVIEEAIYEHPDVAEAAVTGVPDDYRGQAAKAFVVLKPEAAPLTLEGLRAFLSTRIGRHELPAALELRDALPKTPVGKISRRDLQNQ